MVLFSNYWVTNLSFDLQKDKIDLSKAFFGVRKGNEFLCFSAGFV